MFGIMMSDLFDSFPLRKARVHEVCGAGASGFAAIAAARAAEDVLWIHETWRPEALNPVGLSAFCDPAKVLVAQVKTQLEALGVAEETLRDGAIPLVVMELSQPLGLTAGRRLQLAAKDGGTTGLCLISEEMGSNAAETRWRCAPVFDAEDSTLMAWEIIKNKAGTLGVWHVRWDRASRRLDVVSPVGERPGSARASG